MKVLPALLGVAVACSSPPTPIECTDVPDGGCPQDNGANVCEDPSCNAVYDCVGGKWVFDKACPAHPHDASTGPDSGDATMQLPDVAVDWRVPDGAFGGPGCPDLQLPDCSVGTALACSGSTGCCGCQDLWVCDNGGWITWGTCGDAGITQNP